MSFPPYPLPIYTFCGERTQEKQKFLNGLADNLSSRQLSAGIITRQIFRFYEQKSDQEIYQALLTNDLLIIDCLESEGIFAGNNADPEELSAWAMPWTGGFGQNNDLGVRDCADNIYAHLTHLLKKAPVQGCILIGGKSRRMGRPKHLLTNGKQQTWLELIHAQLAPFVEQVYISGAGELPGAVNLPRLSDAEGIDGPLAGLIAAFRARPYANWIFIACDMPLISREAIAWLLKQRGPGRWVIMADLNKEGHVEPFPSYHDYRMGSFWEKLSQNPHYRLTEVGSYDRAYVKNPPEALVPAWENINTPEKMKQS